MKKQRTSQMEVTEMTGAQMVQEISNLTHMKSTPARRARLDELGAALAAAGPQAFADTSDLAFTINMEVK